MKVALAEVVGRQQGSNADRAASPDLGEQPDGALAGQVEVALDGVGDATGGRFEGRFAVDDRQLRGGTVVFLARLGIPNQPRLARPLAEQVPASLGVRDGSHRSALRGPAG